MAYRSAILSAATRRVCSRATNLFVTLMLTQCVCSSNNRPTEIDAAPARPVATDTSAPPSEPDPRPPLDLPASLDTKDLDRDEKHLLQEVLLDQYDPCGKPKSFLESLKSPDTCAEAKKLAALAVVKIADGLSKKQIVQELLEEQARWAKKASFEFAGSPYSGDPATAKKVVVEFFDYQCPHCKLAAKPAKALAEKTGAVLYYKMLPLQHHEHAREAALVALAAHRQGKFITVHELLFENQDRLSSAVIRELAKAGGLDLKKLDLDLADPTLVALLERDIAEATRAEVGGTPTFFVDGYEVEMDQLEASLQAP
jgi:protein-disulfide isomerase